MYQYERTNYETLKLWFLKSAYYACQNKFEFGKISKWLPNESEWGYASYQFENSFDLPVENLMLSVIEIICNAGRHEPTHKICMENIQRIISENNLNDLLSDLDIEEKEEFMADFNLVMENSL